MEDCIFCRIAAHKEKAQVVYEDERFMGFLESFPRTKGHTLVIPKIHYRWVDDVPQFGAYFEAARSVARAIKKAFGSSKTQYLTIGEIVPHAHIHVVPRYEYDRHGGDVDFGVTERFSEKEMGKIAEKIRKEAEREQK